MSETTTENESRPYRRDLVTGSKGLSGSAYVVGELDESRREADGTWVSRVTRAAIQVRTERRCDHSETVCGKCAETWMFDWKFYFDRTGGGRRLRDELGGGEALREMAARRAAFHDAAQEQQAAAPRDAAAMDRIAAELKGWDADAGDWGDIIVAIIGIVRGTNRAVEDHPREEVGG